MQHANEPTIFHYNGHNVALEVENLGNQVIREIPVYRVNVNILPGAIDNPEVLFGAGLSAAYADVLRLAGRAAHPLDSVRMGVHLDGLKSNNGSFYTLNLPIQGQNHYADETALHHFVIAWDEVQQSDDQLHLDQGPLELRFTFTLGGEHQHPEQRVGVRTKKTMYMRQVYDDFYTKTDAIKKVPFTADAYCFPMAFLGCQIRRYVLDESKQNVIDILETNGKKNLAIISQLHQTIDIPEVQLPLFQQQPDFEFMIFENKFVLFNPYKIYTSCLNRVYTYKLDEADTVGKLQMWTSAGVLIHQYVEQTLERPVDRNRLVEVAQAYANVFKVHIHILRVECQLEQTNLFIPENSENLPYMDHVYIVLGDAEGNYEHAHTVTNRRKMMYRLQHNNDISPHNYCDICHSVTENSNVNKRDGLVHLSMCRRNFYTSRNPFDATDINRKEYYHQLHNKYHKFQFDRITRNKNDFFKCHICTDTVPKHMLNYHKCRIPLPKMVPERPIPELTGEIGVDQHPNLWVFDIESAQTRCENTEFHQYIHTPNCLCVRPVYDNDDRLHFHSAEDFCKLIFDNENTQFHGVTFFSHNGGSYDDQFIIQYLERNCIPHSVLPRPGSAHKYLEVIIPRGTEPKDNIIFKDFIVFVPYSLKDIASSFGLSLSKGDFPHKFNNGENDNYIGPHPPLESYEPSRFYKESDRQELQQWYLEQTQIYCTCLNNDVCDCTKQKWNFQEEIQKYCWLDTDILAEAIKLFREQHIAFGDESEEGSNEWQPTAIDPLNHSTQAQAAMTFFLQGHAKSQKKERAAISKPRVRSGYSKKALLWLNEMSHEFHECIQHAGNGKEYFDVTTNSFVDGYAPNSKRIFEFLGCFWHGCPVCHTQKIQEYTSMHPVRNIPWKVLYEKTMEKIEKLQTFYGMNNVHIIWECQWDRDHPILNDHEKILMNIMEDREMFYGGRTEVFSAYAKSTDTDTIEHHDVTSMYPYVCAHKMLPIGHPIIYFGNECQLARLQPTHPDAYFGYVRCHVIPNRNDCLGLLPQKEDFKLQFDVREKVGCWFTAEIHVAMKQGYIFDQIYEVYHFDKNNRSDSFFKGYMGFFLRMKQEAEGWKKAGASSETPSEEEKQRICDQLYQQNGCIGRMRPACVGKNAVKRALAKLNLNCLWGKFAQQDQDRTSSKIVYSYDSWIKDIHKNISVDQTSIRYREMQGGAYMCYYRTTREHERVNPKVNVWLASAVTAWARCILHEQMIKVGPERILYCDTDSIVFLRSKQNPETYVSRGLGNWTSEVEDGNQILEFMGLAPKTYMKVETDCLSGHMKAKGVRMNLSNQEKTTPEIIRQLLEQEFIRNPPGDRVELFLDHMTIFSNSIDSNYDYATVFTRYAKKKLQVVLSKRRRVLFPPSRVRLCNFEIDRLYLAPLSPYKIEDHIIYSKVYDKYKL